MNNKIIKLAFVTTSLLALSLISFVFLKKVVFVSSVSAQSCPSNTTVGDTWATLVGEVTDTGGDPNLEVWFQWGPTPNLGNETPHQFRTGPGLFCSTITGLTPCQTYHFRAVAKNSAGTSYGEIRSFTTRCIILSVDLKANGSDGPITLTVGNSVTLSWTSQGAVSCHASGDWSGPRPTSGNQSIQLNEARNYLFRLTCTNQFNQTQTDQVEVRVIPRLPVVITKPAVYTQ